MRRPALMLVLAAVVGALVAVPVAVYASHSFTDVPDSNTFHEDIAWLADAGVTKGCNPPANTEYCPKDAVTREQMAAFMRRLAENQVVDAGTVQGLGPDDLTGPQGPQGIQGPPGPAPIVETASGTGIGPSDWNTSDPVYNKTEVLNVTLEAPTSGTVVVTGFGLLFIQHQNGFDSTIVFDVTDDLAGFDPINAAYRRIPLSAPSGGSTEMATPQRSFAVAAGSHTFTLVAARPDSTFITAAVFDPNMTAVFYPSS